MKLGWKLGIAIPLVLLTAGIVCWFTVAKSRIWAREAWFAVRPVPHLCRQRATAFQTRVERIRADAKSSLKPGTKKADVIRFFASENIPLAFFPTEDNHEDATGTVYVSGLAECEDIACGDDAALIGLRVGLDEHGAVLSEPEVVGMYTDCL
jgi:hypothetical protein